MSGTKTTNALKACIAELLADTGDDNENYNNRRELINILARNVPDRTLQLVLLKKRNLEIPEKQND